MIVFSTSSLAFLVVYIVFGLVSVVYHRELSRLIIAVISCFCQFVIWFIELYLCFHC